MSRRSVWKVLHLLHTARAATHEELRQAGIECGPDSIDPLLEDLELVERTEDRYKIAKRGRDLLDRVLVAHRRITGQDMRVDHPSAFRRHPLWRALGRPLH
jgi:hypothetical protein